MKTDLIIKPPKRFFAFGCSFTDYYWATWANILGEDLQVKYNTEFYNFGHLGIGNEGIMNLISQADAFYKFNEDDLVIICWTNIARIDRFHGGWLQRGNIFSSGDRKLLRKISVNELLVKNLAYIHLSNNLVAAKGCQHHYLQMCQVDVVFNQINILWQTHIPDLEKVRSIYKDTLASLKPSFYDILWQGDCIPRLNEFDPHPSPIEHYNYLEKLFNHNWDPSTITKITEADDRLDKQFQTILKSGKFTLEQLIQHCSRGLDHRVNEEMLKELYINEGNNLNHLLVNER